MARRRQRRRVELVIGDRDDFGKPARVRYAEVYSDQQAEQALILAAGVEKTDPIRWLYL